MADDKKADEKPDVPAASQKSAATLDKATPKEPEQQNNAPLYDKNAFQAPAQFEYDTEGAGLDPKFGSTPVQMRGDNSK